MIKKLLAVAIVLCVSCSTASAVSVFSDNFDTAGLSAWTVVDSAGTGLTWGLSGTAGHETGNWTAPPGSGQAADASSDVFGSSAYDTSLISPVINTSGGATTVSYVTNYQALGVPPTGDNFDVDWTIDGGATWNLLFAHPDDTPVGGLRTGPGVAFSHAVPAGGQSSTFQFRYRYYNPSSTAFDWYAQVDNVDVDVVPEPASAGLLGLSCVASLFFGLRRRR